MECDLDYPDAQLNRQTLEDFTATQSVLESKRWLYFDVNIGHTP